MGFTRNLLVYNTRYDFYFIISLIINYMSIEILFILTDMYYFNYLQLMLKLLIDFKYPNFSSFVYILFENIPDKSFFFHEF